MGRSNYTTPALDERIFTACVEERRPSTVQQTFAPPMSIFLPPLFQEFYRGDESHKQP